MHNENEQPTISPCLRHSQKAGLACIANIKTSSIGVISFNLTKISVKRLPAFPCFPSWTKFLLLEVWCKHTFFLRIKNSPSFYWREKLILSIAKISYIIKWETSPNVRSNQIKPIEEGQNLHSALFRTLLLSYFKAFMNIWDYRLSIFIFKACRSAQLAVMQVTTVQHDTQKGKSTSSI